MGRGVATVIMEATRDLLQKEEIRVGNEAWRKGDLENVESIRVRSRERS